MACRETTSTMIHGRHSRRCPHTSGRSPSIAPTSTTASREAPALALSLRPTYPFAAAMCCGLSDSSRQMSSDAQVSVGQHHVVALGESEHQLRPSVVDARFSLVLQIPRSTPGRISVEARKIASGDIHPGATTPAASQRAPCLRCGGRRTAILARGVEAPSAKHRDRQRLDGGNP